MNLTTANRIAGQVVDLLRPHCHRIEIAGSIRRRKPEPSDIEIVVLPKPYDVGLFESGIAAVVSRWPKVKGELEPGCRYTQRIVPLVPPLEESLPGRCGKMGDVKLGLFLPAPEAWGLILAIRTGSAAFAHFVLAMTWHRMGYMSQGGVLVHQQTGERRTFAEEADLFSFLGLNWTTPERREWPAKWAMCRAESTR